MGQFFFYIAIEEVKQNMENRVLYNKYGILLFKYIIIGINSLYCFIEIYTLKVN